MPNPHRRTVGAEAAPEPAARPKFSRRPARFSQSAVEASPDAAPAASMPVAMPAAITEPLVPPDTPSLTGTTSLVLHTPAMLPRPWQEDIRFGIAMVLLVLLMNLALLFGLPHLPPPQAPAAPVSIGVAPRAMDTAQGSITLYATPVPEEAITLTPVAHIEGADDTTAPQPDDGFAP